MKKFFCTTVWLFILLFITNNAMATIFYSNVYYKAETKVLGPWEWGELDSQLEEKYTLPYNISAYARALDYGSIEDLYIYDWGMDEYHPCTFSYYWDGFGNIDITTDGSSDSLSVGAHVNSEKDPPFIDELYYYDGDEYIPFDSASFFPTNLFVNSKGQIHKEFTATFSTLSIFAASDMGLEFMVTGDSSNINADSYLSIRDITEDQETFYSDLNFSGVHTWLDEDIDLIKGHDYSIDIMVEYSAENWWSTNTISSAGVWCENISINIEDVNPVPEPSTSSLFFLGMLGMVVVKKRFG